ncbi:ATP/GTP-binding protein [Streptantibioticus ferralitis]|uniref:ATP/GTP-binding protein n=1 Tax=Streptantibioticus ferralitis TaxID=236510 RepID=A0ABT5Z778_9ACTN|nr:ATP/GTP-binding protein [Streptantibioticus ferralitis]MDF2259691.1 ATP/GTP-binding protein [Streptantibioticus ferralitis]
MSPVELRKTTVSSACQGPERRLYTARAELVLAMPDHRPLAQAAGFAPDPLQRVAAAMAGVRSEEGEQADVVLDVIPVSAGAVARRRRVLMRRAKQRGPQAFGEQLGGGLGWWEALVEGLNGGRRPGVRGRAERVPRQVDVKEGVGKFTPGQQVFAVQLLVRVIATHPVRARARLNQLLAAVEVFAGENRFRPVGPRLPWWRPYSNVWWRRRSFDRRLESGEFAPARRQWVTVPEIAGLLKPPTIGCTAVNVARCGGVVPAAPVGLPTFTGQKDVVPLGLVTGADGRVTFGGVPEAGLLFGAFFGKSGFGKTELGLLQAICRAYAGAGVWFLDPHGEALARAKPYLAHPAIASRMWEINLATPKMSDRVASWNPLAMEGRRSEQVQEVIAAIVGGLAAAQEWGAYPRARSILSNAVRTLAELSLLLVADGRPDLQPTVFQIKSLLMNDAWREVVIEHLPPEIAGFWTTTFLDYSRDALPTVVQALDRLDNSLSLRAFLGSPRSSYNVRRAMDDGRVAFVCPAGSGEDELICSLLIFDLFLAGLSRKDTPPGLRRALWGFIDEVAAIDRAARDYLAKILEQLRKYQVRLMAMTQMAMRLSEVTRYALMQNQSILSSTAADIDEAKFVTSRFSHVGPQTINHLRQFEYVMSVRLKGQASSPFKVRGVPIDQALADYYNPRGVPALEAAIDTNLERRSVAEIVDRLRTLDDDIAAHLAVRGRPGTSATGPVDRTPGPRPGGEVVHSWPDAPHTETDVA